MNSPCVRIELEYADGSRQVAEGYQAQRIVEWFDACQAFAVALARMDSEMGILHPPQFTFCQAPDQCLGPEAARFETECVEIRRRLTCCLLCFHPAGRCTKSGSSAAFGSRHCECPCGTVQQKVDHLWRLPGSMCAQWYADGGETR
jgi:hypothetical protein